MGPGNREVAHGQSRHRGVERVAIDLEASTVCE
jgi:hypothetical protein